MAATVDSAALADTILRSATEGYYPDSESIATADLTHAHLPTILNALDAAKEDVKGQVCAISRENAESIDSWISQARQLHVDIEASKRRADAILELDAEEQAMAKTLKEAEARQAFLDAEIRFNETLASMLGKLQLIGATLAQVEVAIARGELEQVVGTLGSADEALEKLVGFEEIIVVGLMKENSKALQGLVLERVEEAWNGLVVVDKERGEVTVRTSVEFSSAEIDSETVVATLATLELLKDKIDQFHQRIDQLLIFPRLDTQAGRIPRISVEGDTLRIVGYADDLSPVRLFADLRTVIDFLDSRLPASVMSNLSRILIPNLTNRLISTRLSSSVPPTLDDLPAFEELLKETRLFEDGLHKKGWTRESELGDWVDRAPKVWLAKRRESSLDTARKILASGVGEIETVERSETRSIWAAEGHDALAAGVTDSVGDDEWPADWNDQEDVAPEEKPGVPETRPAVEIPKPAQPSGYLDDDDDDDGADGWGLDEDLGLDDDGEEPQPEAPKEKPVPPQEDNSDDEEMDWGAWGDYGDDEGSSKPAPTVAKHTHKKSISTDPSARNLPTDRRPSTSKPATKDITLTETYTITSTPRALLALITSLLSEATQLQTNPIYAASPITPAAPGILTIPTLILALFRALAPLHYSKDLRSNMYLYNDCSFLCTSLPASLPEKSISQLLAFGNRQYSLELESQRTILYDYLDGAQGFSSCTDLLQNQECSATIASTISRIKELAAAWKPVLSTSTLYQSLGTLLATVLTKLVNDIEDLQDISEPESIQLAGYCRRLSDLATTVLGGSADTAIIYLGGNVWRRFQFLEKVLESTLAEIMGLVREGLLEVFEVGEVVELVRALFADSQMRTTCIEDIRREGGGVVF